MAKNYYIFFCVLFLYSCGARSDNHSDLIQVIEDRQVVSIEPTDMPVTVDTFFADTTTLVSIIADSDPAIEPLKEAIIEKRALNAAETASKYIGVREKTGKNDGAEVERFLRHVGLGKGFPWCAAFVKTCLLESGVESAHKINGMALSCENKKNFIWKNGTHIKEPEPGDVFTLYYPQLKRIGHTGFYEKPYNSKFYVSIEGNTNSEGSREGDGVYRKKRSYNATYSISRWN